MYKFAKFAWKSTPGSASTELLYSPHIPNRHHSFGLQNVHFLTSCNIIRAVLNALKFQENTLSLVKLHVYRLSAGIELWVLLQLPGHCCPKCLAKLSTLVSIDIIKYYQHRTISMPLIVYVTAFGVFHNINNVFSLTFQKQCLNVWWFSNVVSNS